MQTHTHTRKISAGRNTLSAPISPSSPNWRRAAAARPSTSVLRALVSDDRRAGSSAPARFFEKHVANFREGACAFLRVACFPERAHPRVACWRASGVKE